MKENEQLHTSIADMKKFNQPLEELWNNPEDAKLDKEIMCESCETATATHIQEPNPYVQAIQGKIQLVNYCDACYKRACDDI
jgi:hypothetical protein